MASIPGSALAAEMTSGVKITHVLFLHLCEGTPGADVLQKLITESPMILNLADGEELNIKWTASEASQAVFYTRSRYDAMYVIKAVELFLSRNSSKLGELVAGHVILQKH